MAKIVENLWFTELGSPRPIGIIVVENEVGDRKAYIGTGMGGDEGLDSQRVAGNGAKLSKSTLQLLAARVTK
jgi:hypothetical protein